MLTAVRRIGLTGGIGSGKSTVAQILKQLGAVVVDADAISRQLTAIGGEAIPAIVSKLGAEAIGSDGAMNRDAVRTLLFNDPTIRQQLEAIIHPLVGLEMTRLTELAVAAGRSCVVYDLPLLVESSQWRSQLDCVLVVDCLPLTQIDRVLARESKRAGWTSAAVEKVISAQASRAQRLSAADICVYNDGLSLGRLKQIVRQVAMGFGL